MWVFSLLFRYIREMGRCIRRFGRPRKIVRGPRDTNFPQPPKFEPLTKRFFSPHNSKAPICQSHLCIYRMNLFFIEGMTELLVNLNEVKNLACEKSRYIGIRSTVFRSEWQKSDVLIRLFFKYETLMLCSDFAE